MRTVSAATTAAWKAAFKGGGAFPRARATIQRLNVAFTTYSLDGLPGSDPDDPGKPRQGTGVFASMAFGQADQPIELPTVRMVTWTRGTDQDVAECTLELANTEVVPLGQAPDDPAAFERPGWFTPGRGSTAESQSRWGQTPNGWAGVILPDRVVRIYEGYGQDLSQIPEADPNLYLTGTWLIDEAEFTADGRIVLKMRDFGSVLLSQILYPPVVPWAEYPLSFERYHSVDNPDIIGTETQWFRPAYDTDSNIPYIGAGLTDGPRAYVDSKGGILGHYGSHAFDSSASTFWLSVGNYPNWSSAYEFVQGKFSSRTINAVQVHAWGGPYTMYVSVYAGGKWQGSSKIPYRHQLIDTNADIPFVKSVRIANMATLNVKLPKNYAGATKVRITFTDLYDSGVGEFRWRAGCYDVRVAGEVTTTTDGGTHVEGNYDDYTDIIKWLTGWAGFYWPSGSSGLATQTLSDGTQLTVAPPGPDAVLPGGGRIWGDFEQTGTNGEVALGVETFDKKPVMDGISYVRDIVNFIFFVDEAGGVVWRSPNIWSIGNYVAGLDGGPVSGRTSTVITIDERETLTQLSAKLSSHSVRERVFVANSTGTTGAVAAGYNPAPSGLRRAAGWTDQRFESQAEAQVMADLITIRQMFEYRKDQLRIPANPSIQIDDQVRIFERTTAETYYHYVRSISSTNDLTNGTWHYDLTTNWMGDSPATQWWLDETAKAALAQETRDYLARIGKL